MDINPTDGEYHSAKEVVYAYEQRQRAAHAANPDKPGNPCHFNPDGMTVSALKACSDVLRAIFDGIDRGVDPDNLLHHLEQARTQLLRRHGKAPN